MLPDHVRHILNDTQIGEAKPTSRLENTLSPKEITGLNEIKFTNPKINDEIKQDFDTAKYEFVRSDGATVSMTGKELIYCIANFVEECGNRGELLSSYDGKLRLDGDVSINIAQGSEMLALLQSGLVAYGYNIGYTGSAGKGIDGRL